MKPLESEVKKNKVSTRIPQEKPKGKPKKTTTKKLANHSLILAKRQAGYAGLDFRLCASPVIRLT